MGSVTNAAEARVRRSVRRVDADVRRMLSQAELELRRRQAACAQRDAEQRAVLGMLVIVAVFAFIAGLGLGKWWAA